MNKLILLCALLLVAYGCGEKEKETKSAFNRGDVVEFIISKQKAQVIEVACYASECFYKLRIVEGGGQVDYRKTETVTHIHEFEIKSSSIE